MSNQPPTNEPWQQPLQQPYPGNQPYPQQPPQQNYGQPQWQQQQPYSLQQPIYQQQPMQPPPRKKSKTWLWIVLGVIAVLVLGCICASALAFNAAKNVKVGDTWDVSVNSMKTSKGDQFSVPKSGNTYLIIDLTMKNISTQEQKVSSLISFNLLDSTGQKYTETLTTMSDIHPPDGKVEAGAPLRGQLVYEVPISMKDYTLSFQADITSSGQTIWDIHM